MNQLLVERSEMRASALIARDFYGFRRKVINEIDLPIRVGPHLFTIMFQVMDISPAYRYLLGRPCIHVVGEVTSMLNQKLKFMVDDKLVIIFGEEDPLISELSSFRYVEIDEGAIEVPFHFLEFDNVNTTTSNFDKALDICEKNNQFLLAIIHHQACLILKTRRNHAISKRCSAVLGSNMTT